MRMLARLFDGPADPPTLLLALVPTVVAAYHLKPLDSRGKLRLDDLDGGGLTIAQVKGCR